MTARLLILATLIGVGLSAQTPGWRNAVPGRLITLPADHASHPDYKIEWWYYTGNLDAAGRRFGYQLTFFRLGINRAPVNPSRWALGDVFMAHFAVTDVEGRRHQFSERLNRPGPGWAGAATDIYRVWNEDWQVSLDEKGGHHLSAAASGFGIDLHLTETRATLHGEDGYSQKGKSAGNASYYYSITRMPTTGSILLDGRRIPVTGQSWMDHEFGTTFLEPEQVGWDWLSLQLDTGHDLMVFRLRRADGSIDAHSSGTIVAPDGTTSRLTLEDFSLEPGRTWTSATGARYPVAWRVRVPRAGIDVSVAAVLENQELSPAQAASVTYWEGAIDATGMLGGFRVAGRGYLEMTGYAGPSMSTLLR
jgi:predicted secreted hydrolase